MDQVFALIQEWNTLRWKCKKAIQELKKDPNNPELKTAALECEDDLLRVQMRLEDLGVSIPEVVYEQENPYPKDAFRRSGP